jgi:hypothetical protein
VKHFYSNRERCEVLIGYLSLGRRIGEYVTLDKTFQNMLIKQKAAAAPSDQGFI